MKAGHYKMQAVLPGLLAVFTLAGCDRGPDISEMSAACQALHTEAEQRHQEKLNSYLANVGVAEAHELLKTIHFDDPQSEIQKNQLFVDLVAANGRLQELRNEVSIESSAAAAEYSKSCVFPTVRPG